MTAPKDEVPWTKAPWEVRISGIRGGFGIYIPEAAVHEAVVADYDGVDGHTVSSANARLIAEAPTMAALLEEAVKRFRLYEMALDSEATADHRSFMRKCEEVLSRLGRGK